MDPAGLLLSVATIAVTIDQIQESYNATSGTLQLIRSQIKILETGVQRIQEWLHFTDPTSKAQVMDSLQDAIFTVYAAVERLQEDLASITRTGPKTSKMLGRSGSDQWVKTKFAYNEPRMRKHLTDVRECVSLIHFTLSVSQLPLGQGATREVKELELCARKLSRAHTSARRQRETIINEQQSGKDLEHSEDYKAFMQSVLRAEADLPDEGSSDDTLTRQSSWDTSILDLDTTSTLPRDRDELHMPAGVTSSSPLVRSETSPVFSGPASRARQSSMPYPVHTSEYAAQRQYSGFTSAEGGKGFVFKSSNGPTIPPKVVDSPPSASARQKSISRKPVNRSSVSEGTPAAVAGASSSVTPEKAPDNVMLSPPAPPPTQPAIHASSSTNDLFNQVSQSLTTLTDGMNNTELNDNVESPPPYVAPAATDLPSMEDVKRRDTQSSVVPATEPPMEPTNAIQLVRDNRLDLLRGLLKQGYSVDDADPVTKRTAIMEAAALRRSSAAQILVKAGCRLHLKDGEGHTALHLAAEQGDPETCAILLEAGAQLDEYDNHGEIPLSLAARGGHTDTVLCLLNSWTAQKSNGTSLLKGFLEASKSGNVSTATAFVERGINPKKIKESWRPVAYAAQSGSVPMIDFMLVHKCNLKERSPDGWTALHFAAKEGNTAVVEKLLAWKLSWKAQTKKDKETALHLSILNNQPATAMALILHKDANITMKDADGQQPIHHAVRNGDLVLSTTLLNRGAKTDDETEYGYTPMLLAAAYGHVPLVAEFLTRGVSTEVKLASPDFKPTKKTNEAARKGYWAEIRWPHSGARPLHLVGLKNTPFHTCIVVLIYHFRR